MPASSCNCTSAVPEGSPLASSERARLSTSGGTCSAAAAAPSTAAFQVASLRSCVKALPTAAPALSRAAAAPAWPQRTASSSGVLPRSCRMGPARKAGASTPRASRRASTTASWSPITRGVFTSMPVERKKVEGVISTSATAHPWHCCLRSGGHGLTVLHQQPHALGPIAAQHAVVQRRHAFPIQRRAGVKQGLNSYRVLPQDGMHQGCPFRLLVSRHGAGGGGGEQAARRRGGGGAVSDGRRLGARIGA